MTNIIPATVNAFWRVALPNLPILLGFVFIVNPPKVVSQIIFPIISTFLSAKVRDTHVLIYGARKELWAARLAHFNEPITSIPTELGGTADVDIDAYIAIICEFGNMMVSQHATTATCHARTSSSSTASLRRAPTQEE